MTGMRSQKGLSMIELLVSVTILLVCLTALATTLIQNARINRSQQMSLQVQSDARNCLAMIVPVVRTAGWDPMNLGIPTAVVGVGGSQIQVFADINEDGDTDDADEDVTIRFVGSRIEWRKTSDVSQPFVILSEGITNDADGDGTAEPMFTADSGTDPTRITVRITARSPVPDPRGGGYLRYTMQSDAIFRGKV